MLQEIQIKNYALIDEAVLHFDTGFSVITGETGAGKSILLGALGLILGKRADLSSIGDPSSKCVIEATFKVAQYDLESFFIEEDLDFEPTTLIRREILPSGKSRAFINDTPVNLGQLSALGARLVDIHSQHQTLEVTANAFQFRVLDAFADAALELDGYKKVYTTFTKDRSKLKKLETQRAEAQKEKEYKAFLLIELLEANLKPGEQDELEIQYQSLNNVEQITENLSEAYQNLTQEEIGVNDLLVRIKQHLDKLKEFSTPLHEVFERLQSVQIELDDITDTINDLVLGVENDPESLARIDARLKLFYDLQQKHHVGSLDELIIIREDLDGEVQSLAELDDEISRLEKAIAYAKAELETLAFSLGEKRKKAIPALTKELERLLKLLGISNARFEIELTTKEQFYENGNNTLQFLFSANKGMPVQELGKAASGGELSRIMLAVKAILSDYAKLPTLIFDEIDTGVSGEIALQMGTVMKQMGKHMQLISITHLPQIAGLGNHHFKVFKFDQKSRTVTNINKLTKEERIQEIAEMLGGKSSSEAARSHALQLLDQ